jgi:hypothetical protein
VPPQTTKSGDRFKGLAKIVVSANDLAPRFGIIRSDTRR